MTRSTFRYYLHDNSTYRGGSDGNYPRGAREIWADGRLIPYTGDAMEPVVFGRQISQSEAETD